jgi:hypothetical protein
MIAGAVIFQAGQRAIRWALGAAFLGVLTLGYGLFVDARRVFLSYLVAHVFFLSIALGALVFLMIGHAMNAVWPVALRRLTETIAGTIPLFAILFIPICFGLETLYPWASPEEVIHPHERHLLEHKLPYLNVPFFLLRTALYFALWSALAVLLRRWSIQTDEDRAPSAHGERTTEPAGRRSHAKRARVLSAAFLPLVGLSVMFAAFDWLMSLNPFWTSTLFGIYFGAGCLLAALSFLALSAFLLQRRRFLPGVDESHSHALGRLLLAFTLFWSYVAYFQYFLIWLANRPEEVVFYLERSRNGANVLTGLLIFGHATAFFALLPYRVKQRAGYVAAVAGWLLLFRYMDVYWLVIPSLRPGGLSVHWLDLGALLAAGGASFAFGVWLLRGRPTTPIHDPALPAALQYKSP